MQPKIIKKDKLYITGLSGDGSKTSELWSEFDRKYKATPFPQADENGYEIRFFDAEKSVDKSKDIHVGFLTETEINDDNFTTVVLPASEYAVFAVYVAKGYDSGNAAMDKWLEDNSTLLKNRDIDGNGFIIEHYNDKFKNGNQPDSIVAFWVPFYRFCQSCFMPMTTEDKFCIESDGSQNMDYCCYCGSNFTDGPTLEEFIEENLQFWRDGCKDDGEARARMRGIYPKLKRWAK